MENMEGKKFVEFSRGTRCTCPGGIKWEPDGCKPILNNPPKIQDLLQAIILACPEYVKSKGMKFRLHKTEFERLGKDEYSGFPVVLDNRIEEGRIYFGSLE